MMPRTKPVQIKPHANQEIGWDDIAGVDEAKDELREVVEFLRDPRKFKQLGAQVPKGILLHGPPGTGKTLLAKAVAHESDAQFFSQSASSFVEMFAGLGAARIRRLFDEARKHEPAILFIDELDAVGARRGSDMNSEREQTLNQLLVEMDGFSSSGRLVVMAASNLLEKLDPALLRPGRFDRQVFVSPPDVSGRRAHPRGPHAHQAAARGRRPRPRRPADERPDRRRPREHLQRGGDLLRPPRRPGDRRPRLRRRHRARHRRRAVLDDAERARAPCRRLPRGRPRAVPRAAARPRRRPRPQDLDRPARPRARLRRQPPRRGLLPQDARRAHRPDDRPARRPRRGADRLRRRHDRRRERPPAGRRDHPRDDPRLRDGLQPGAAGDPGGRDASRTSRGASATRSSASSPSRPTAPRGA